MSKYCYKRTARKSLAIKGLRIAPARKNRKLMRFGENDA
jgi:hypothetical protein